MKRGDIKNQQTMYRLIDKWEISGLTQKAFCQSEGLNYFTFKYWKSKRGGKAVTLLTHSNDTAAPDFIPIQVSESDLISDQKVLMGTCYKMEFPNGVKVHCPEAISFDQIKMLIQIF